MWWWIILSKTKYVKFDTFTTALGVIGAVIILLGTFVFLSAFAEEIRYVGMIGGDCKECYLPQKIVIEADGVVMWENVDNTVHTVTSGTLLEPTNSFNSGLIAPSKNYSLQFVNAGIYVLDKKLINKVDGNSYLDMTDLLENELEAGDINAFPIYEYWLDIGRTEEYERANREIQDL